MPYVIAGTRGGKKPVYFTMKGSWSPNIDHARRFATRSELATFPEYLDRQPYAMAKVFFKRVVK